jgi:hypothetical protein
LTFRIVTTLSFFVKRLYLSSSMSDPYMTGSPHRAILASGWRRQDVLGSKALGI